MVKALKMKTKKDVRLPLLSLINFSLNYSHLINTFNFFNIVMLLFKNKQKGVEGKSLSSNYITEKPLKPQSYSQRDEYNKIIFYPSSSKE
jgi:ABC-type sugar transport system permease subunit